MAKKSTVIQVGNYKFYMDGYLQSNLDEVKKVVKKDWDFVFIVDGMEGGGKSTLAIQVALYVDNSFCLDRIVFDSESFEKAVLKAEKYQAVIYDEAITGLYSREAMQYINTTLTKLLAQIRQKNLFIFVIMPSFFDLDKYVSMWRARGLFHIYTKDFQRGYFGFYDYQTKKDLFILGKKYYNYNFKKPTFKGRYVSFNPFEREYRKLKIKAIDKRQEQSINPFYQRDKLILAMWKDYGIKQKDIAKIAGIHQSLVTYICQKQTVRI